MVHPSSHYQYWQELKSLPYRVLRTTSTRIHHSPTQSYNLQFDWSVITTEKFVVQTSIGMANFAYRKKLLSKPYFINQTLQAFTVNPYLKVTWQWEWLKKDRWIGFGAGNLMAGIFQLPTMSQGRYVFTPEGSSILNEVINYDYDIRGIFPGIGIGASVGVKHLLTSSILLSLQVDYQTLNFNNDIDITTEDQTNPTSTPLGINQYFKQFIGASVSMYYFF